MRPHGTIYRQSVFNKKRGEVRISLPYRLKVIYNYIYFWGTCFLIASSIGLIISFAPIVKEETKYELQKNGVIKNRTYAVVENTKASEPDDIQKETFNLGINSDFSIVIPKIDARSNIVANVNTADQKEYMDSLTKGVAHAKGTYMPGEGKQVFLFAHSTNVSLNVARYNAVFYLLSKLENGDLITIYYENKKYTYTVIDARVTPANDTAFLSQKTSKELLFLMTCTPPGTTWQRLFIIAEPA